MELDLKQESRMKFHRSLRFRTIFAFFFLSLVEGLTLGFHEVGDEHNFIAIERLPDHKEYLYLFHKMNSLESKKYLMRGVVGVFLSGVFLVVFIGFLVGG